MKRWIVVLLAVALVGALGTTWFQYNRLGQAERILGKYWSNDFASVFSNLGVVNQELHRIATDGELGEDTGMRLDRALSSMTPHLTNTLGDTRGYLPNVPDVPYLVGYLDQVRESVNVHLGCAPYLRDASQNGIAQTFFCHIGPGKAHDQALHAPVCRRIA